MNDSLNFFDYLFILYNNSISENLNLFNSILIDKLFSNNFNFIRLSYNSVSLNNLFNNLWYLDYFLDCLNYWNWSLNYSFNNFISYFNMIFNLFSNLRFVNWYCNLDFSFNLDNLRNLNYFFDNLFDNYWNFDNFFNYLFLRWYNNFFNDLNFSNLMLNIWNNFFDFNDSLNFNNSIN